MKPLNNQVKSTKMCPFSVVHAPHVFLRNPAKPTPLVTLTRDVLGCWCVGRGGLDAA